MIGKKMPNIKNFLTGKKHNASLTNEIKLLKAQIQVDNSNCKKEFSKFVTSEVMSLVNDTNDFESVLKDYKKNNPQYFGETVITKTQTAPSLNNGGTQPQTTSNIMNEQFNKRCKK